MGCGPSYWSMQEEDYKRLCEKYQEKSQWSYHSLSWTKHHEELEKREREENEK